MRSLGVRLFVSDFREKQEYIQWTPLMFKAFKKAFDAACKANVEQFVFDGHDFLTAYAKYLIEYLEPKLGGKHAQRG